MKSIEIKFDYKQYNRNSLKLLLDWFLIMINTYGLQPESAAELLFTLSFSLDGSADEEFGQSRPAVVYKLLMADKCILNANHPSPMLHNIVYPLLTLYQKQPELIEAWRVNRDGVAFEQVWDAMVKIVR